MRRTLLVTVVVFLPLLVSGVAYAATLYTSPILVDAGTYYVRCSLTNVGTVPYVVTIAVLDGTGASQDGFVGITVNPGQTLASVFGFAAVNVCKFIVPVPSRVRAGACMSAFGPLTCLDSSDAR